MTFRIAVHGECQAEFRDCLGRVSDFAACFDNARRECRNVVGLEDEHGFSRRWGCAISEEHECRTRGFARWAHDRLAEIRPADPFHLIKATDRAVKDFAAFKVAHDDLGHGKEGHAGSPLDRFI